MHVAVIQACPEQDVTLPNPAGKTAQTAMRRAARHEGGRLRELALCVHRGLWRRHVRAHLSPCSTAGAPSHVATVHYRLVYRALLCDSEPELAELDLVSLQRRAVPRGGGGARRKQ